MRIAIVSGASSGIGRCIAKELDSLGLDELWIIGRSLEKLDSLSRELNTPSRVFQLDLTKEKSFTALIQELSKGHSVEYLVVSAGVGYTGAFEKLSHTEISNMTELNCTALSLLTSVVLPYINKEGKILFLASGAGFLPQPNFAVYAASKAYVISFARALREELKERKIKVTAACPGPVDTDFFAGLSNVKEYKKRFLISPEVVARGAVLAVQKNKAIYVPTFSMKLLRFMAKILPTTWLLKFSK